MKSGCVPHVMSFLHRFVSLLCYLIISPLTSIHLKNMQFPINYFPNMIFLRVKQKTFQNWMINISVLHDKWIQADNKEITITFVTLIFLECSILPKGLTSTHCCIWIALLFSNIVSNLTVGHRTLKSYS